MRIARLLRRQPCGAHRRAPGLLAALATLATLARFAVASALGAGAVHADDRDTNPPVSSPPPLRLSPPPRELPNAAPDREIVDLYRSRRGLSGPMALAEMELMEGENVVLLKLVDKNARSSGLGLDVTTLTFERVR